MGRNEDGTAPRYGDPEPPLYPNGAPIYNQRLVRLWKKNEMVYLAIVDPSVIQAELRRDITSRPPVAEDNTTVRRETFTNTKGSGWFYEHHNRRSFAYQRDRSALRTLRYEAAQTVLTVLSLSDLVPLKAAIAA